jgi:hypothetical protein
MKTEAEIREKIDNIDSVYLDQLFFGSSLSELSLVARTLRWVLEVDKK